jgi:hypothetical protein
VGSGKVMTAQSGRQGVRVGAGIVAVLVGVGFGAAAIGMAVTTGERVAAAQSAQNANRGGGGDAGLAPYLVAAGQGLVTPPDVEDVEHMCALLTSCHDLPFPSSMLPTNEASCVSAIMKDLTSPDAVKYPLVIRECALQANSCADLRSCALRGAAPDSCKGWGKTNTVGRCDLDGRAINCLHEQVVGVRECPRGGEQCYVREGQASCVLGPCTAENAEGAAATCSASGNRVLKCNGGKLTSIDCAAFGLKCTLENGRPGCSPQTPACSGDAKRCDGNVAIGCEHGHEVRVDCGAAGLTCNSVPGAVPVGSCMAPPPANAGDKCDPKDPPRCDGATIKYCFAGRKRSYLCRTLGFDKCVKEGNTAHCQ